VADVSERDDRGRAGRLTARGRATRERILQAAAELMRAHGVAATTLDDVRVASGTSKSQLYRHFPDKEALVHAVIAFRGRQVLCAQEQQLQRLSTLRGLERWRDAMVQRNALVHGAYGCVLGSLASELADQDDDARSALVAHFQTWERLLAAGLARMRASGVLRPEADVGALATGLMAALQGGYLLAQMARDVRPMEIALDMALAHVKAFATGSGDAAAL
jgi:TetR/AcrR family transcriptional repressor of nem operon